MSTNLTEESKNAIENYLSKMKRTQKEFLEIIKEEKNKDIKLIEFIKNINKLEIKENCHELISFLHFLSQISQTHHHRPGIIKIVEDLLFLYKKDIQKHLQNGQIFSIFKNDKKILLFLYKSKIILLDQFVLFNLKSDNYSTFFFPEVKNVLPKEKIDEISHKINNDFEKMREQGERYPALFEIFRNDSVTNLLDHNLNTFSIDYETNPFLIENLPKNLKVENLLELATLFGSTKIFQYLLSKNSHLSGSLWDFAINGQNLEVMKILKEKSIEPTNKTYKDLFIESLKCHNSDISNYIHDNFLLNVELNSIEFIPFYFKYYNFEYIKTEFVDKSNINDLCIFDYPFIVDTLLKHEKEIDVNKKMTVNESTGKLEIKNKEDTKIFEYNGNIKKTPLYNAVSENNVEVAKLLLSTSKIDVNYKYKYTLEFNIKWRFVFYLISIIYGVLPCFKDEPSYFFIITFQLILIVLGNIEFKVYFFSSFDWVSLISLKSLFSIEFKTKEFTILHLAVENNNYEISKLLLSLPNIDVNALKKEYTKIRSKITALYLATENNNADIVKLLLSKSKIDVNIKNIFYINRPLQIKTMIKVLFFIAILSGNILSKIVSFAFFFDYNTNLPDFCAKESIGDLLLYSFLINLIFSSFNIISKILFYIIYAYSIIEIFSSLKCFLFTEITALNMAVFNGNIEITKLLLSVNNIDVNRICNARCIQNPYHRISFGYRIIEEEKTPLYLACEKGDEEIASLLLSDKKINENIEYNFLNYNLLCDHASLPFVLTLIARYEGLLCKRTVLTAINKNQNPENTLDIDDECKKQIGMDHGMKSAILKNLRSDMSMQKDLDPFINQLKHAFIIELSQIQMEKKNK